MYNLKTCVVANDFLNLYTYDVKELYSNVTVV